jgi:hypothetical protein
MSPPRSVLLRIAVVGVWLVLTLYFHSPVREVMTPTLDSSNYASYAYFTANGFQYGTEAISMAGPYGFILYGATYSGHLFGLRTLGELLLNGVLAALTLWFFHSQRHTRMRWIWLFIHLASTSFSEDLSTEWLLLLGGLFLLHPRTGPAAHFLTLAVTVPLALICLIKGTQLALGLATIGTVLAGHAWQRDWRRAGMIAAGYASSLILLWLAAGQSLSNLPAYFRGILELASGYNDTMGIAESQLVFWRGLFVSGTLIGSLAVAAWNRRHEPMALTAIALLAGHCFVQWKHGFVRADGHVYLYFNFAIVAGITVWLLGRPTVSASTPRGLRISAGCLLLACVIANCLGRNEPMLPAPHVAPLKSVRRLADRFEQLRSLPIVEQEFAAELSALRFKHDLPLTRYEVGNASIDLYGVEQGLILLNELNYRPRPMGGGAFNVYTPTLMQLNRDFLRDPARRPDYYLFRVVTIDGRLAAQDDGLALYDLLHLYQPFGFEHDHLLMRSRSEAVSPEPVLHSRRTFTFGEAVPVPAIGDDEILLARFDLPPSLIGQLQAQAYKPAMVSVHLNVRDEHSTISRRLVPRMASSPFIFSPLLDSNEDFLALHTNGSGRSVESFTLTTPSHGNFTPQLAVEFYRAPRPPPLPSRIEKELHSRFNYPFANRAPDMMTPPFRPHDTIYFLHAPAELAWKLTGEERELIFEYGIAPDAYTRGTTNGVEFAVEVRSPSGGIKRAFSRTLQPLTVPADQGRHNAHVALPIYESGSTLVLLTSPGEYGDNAWDWSYATRIELKPGEFTPDQFPGFNRIPSEASAEHAAVLETDDGKAFLLHIPGKVGFELSGQERRLELDFGFLPGAYSGGGATQGGDFVVELMTADGSIHEIARRSLKPTEEPADRGLQSLNIPLPAISPGDRLYVRTAPVPGGGIDWGWTYLTRLDLQE